MNNALRYITGYLFGGAIFIVLVPFGFYELSRLDYLVNYQSLLNSMTFRYILALLFLLAGMVFMIWSNVFLFFVGKGGPAEGFGVEISPRTKELVTTGPYRYSRNPMVFGAFSLYASLVIYLNTFFGLIGLLLLLFVAISYLKLSEEKRLIREFGKDYLDYRRKVSMIFPFKRFTS